jgi:hypothetical protein
MCKFRQKRFGLRFNNSSGHPELNVNYLVARERSAIDI